MKRRTVNKVERRTLVDKVCELQMQIDEYERFLGDVLVMLSKGRSSCVIEHNCGDYAPWIWRRIEELLVENAKLRAKCGSEGADFAVKES